MKVYVEAEIAGYLWDGTPATRRQTIPVPRGTSVRAALERVVRACDDFQPLAKQFDPDSLVVIETTLRRATHQNMRMRGSAFYERSIRQRSYCIGEIPCLNDLVAQMKEAA